MATRNRLKHIVAQTLSISNREAISLVYDKRITINNQTGTIQQLVSPEDEICLDGNIIRPGKKIIYLAYHKPRGVESTFNRNIVNNLHHHIHLPEDVFYLGRLDKESEGLMIFTNNGKLHDKILREDYNREKEYVVVVNKPITAEFIEKMHLGIRILGKITKPAKVFQENEITFRIILTQGMNRQIRRMCYKCGYEVITLKRTAIAGIQLGDLSVNEIRNLTSDEERLLKN